MQLPKKFLAVQREVEKHDLKHLYLFSQDLGKLQEWAALLGPAKMNVLDIGSGAGLWPWILKKECRHTVTLTNAPVDRNLEILYRKGNRALGLDCQDFLVSRRTPLPIEPGVYDAITCLRVAFCTGWKKADWEFFISDALSRLRPGGCLFLWLNRGGAAAEPFKEIKKLKLDGWIAPDVLIVRRPS